MSNLGWYQILTSMAKKVGGPKQLVGMILGGGVLLGGGAEIAGTRTEVEGQRVCGLESNGGVRILEGARLHEGP